MFTDMVGYTKLMQSDEAKAKRLRDRHRNVIKTQVTSFEGEILQYYGDGTLCLFNSSIEAIDCAIQIQTQLQEDPIIPLRIGIHSGDVVHDQEGIYGDGVNVASRIESLSISGSVLISDKVMDDIKSHPAFKVKSLGVFELKNVDRPMEVFALANAPLTVPKKEEIRGKGKTVFKSLAVLPFVNMSNDPENEYFSDGITEELLNALAKVDGLRVTARTSSFAFKGKNMDVREVAKQLDVQNVLEGSVRKSGNRVRITAQLINALDGFHTWSETFDRDLIDIFEVQDEISQIIARQLRKKLAGKQISEPLVKHTTNNIDAYNLYLKGQYFWNKWSPDNIQKAIKFYEKSANLQPDFALPYTGIASCYIFLGITGNRKLEEAFPKAKEAAEKALQLDDQQEGSHLAVAMVKYMYQLDYKGARKSFKRALDLNPGFAASHQYYSFFLASIDEIDAAVKEIEIAHQLDPFSLAILCHMGDYYFKQGKYELAIEKFELVHEMDQAFRMAWEGKGWVLVKMGKLDKALECFKEFQRLTGSELKGMPGLGYVYARMGKEKEARECLKKLELRKTHEKNVDLTIDFAIIHTGLRDWENAFKYLEKALQNKVGLLFLSTHPMWEEMRGKKQYQALLKKFGIR